MTSMTRYPGVLATWRWVQRCGQWWCWVNLHHHCHRYAGCKCYKAYRVYVFFQCLKCYKAYRIYVYSITVTDMQVSSVSCKAYRSMAYICIFYHCHRYAGLKCYKVYRNMAYLYSIYSITDVDLLINIINTQGSLFILGGGLFLAFLTMLVECLTGSNK